MRYSFLHIRIMLFIVAIFAMNNVVFAGTPAGTFVLVNRANVLDIAAYETAIMQADLENFRYQNTRCLITFDNGIQFELLSAAELVAFGQNIIIGNYKTTDVPSYTMPVLHLNDNGTLTAAYSKPIAKQKLLNTN